MRGRLGRRPVLGAMGGALVAHTAAAQAEWRPDRPVRMIVPSGPGSGADVVARALAAKLADLLGQGVVVDNQSQGVGAVGIMAAVETSGSTRAKLSPVAGRTAPNRCAHS